MWSSENERLGVKNCSFTAYLLIKIAYVGIVSSVIIFFLFGFTILQKIFYSEFSSRLFLLFLIPIVFFTTGLILRKVADYLLKRMELIS